MGRLRAPDHGSIMASPLPALPLWILGLGLGLIAVPAARAQTPSPNQPEALSGPIDPSKACPLIVPRDQAALQPLHIQPRQVPLKNRLGCLSPADAIYGADGCPRRLCGNAGALTLPPP
jgi:hypothetical protein